MSGKVRYWYAPMMMRPYWWVSDNWADNADADTDMGGLTPDDFHRYFPRAFEISEEQYNNQSIDPDEVELKRD